MRGKRVLVDVDDVLCDFCTPATAFIQARFGLTIERKCLGHWDIFLAMSQEQRQIFDDEFFREGRCASLEMLPGSADAISGLRRHAEVVAVTRPPDNSRHWVHERTEWLISKLGFKRDSIIHTQAKHMVEGDVFVDDSPENVLKWQAYHPHGIGLLWAAPNTEYALQFESFRVRTWADVVKHVNA